MLFSELVNFFEKIERITARTTIIDSLVNLFRKTPKDIIDKVVYLIQGEIYPDYYGIELGIGEKLTLRAISNAYGVETYELEKLLKKFGDIGRVAEYASKRKKQVTLFRQQLTVKRVYETLEKIAKTTGEKSQDIKVRLLSSLYVDASPKEAKYLTRIVLGELRLGVADMTILDALAIAFAKSIGYREEIEKAYNLCSDLGEIAKVLANEGLEGIRKYKIKPGRPIRMMLAQRVENVREAALKLGREIAAEWKYDGERFQAHKIDSKVILFSRRLENITEQYPDAVDLIRKRIKAKETIIEGEIVAINPETGEFLPFQELMHRRRKHDIESAVKKYPINIFLFDILYKDGESLIERPYKERRKILEEIVDANDRLMLSKQIITKDLEEIQKFFLEAIENGCEGLVLKDLDGIYRAGAREWLWIKLKKSYQSKMIEPVDLVVVGAFYGKGRRAKSYGALLVASYNKEKDIYETVCKVGSGFTDADIERLPEILDKYKMDRCHPKVFSKMEADVWFEPRVVIEVIGDELTLSPVHTCCYGKIQAGSGIAIRFPRFLRYRFDKDARDATTSDEILDMYKRQLKKVE